MDQQVSVEEFLEQLLAIAHPLAPFEMPLLDAHGASLASDIVVGDRVVMEMGSRIRSTHIGLAASIGLNHLPTRPHPRVVVISAGDDLVEPGAPLADLEDEYETNSWMLATAVKEAGATAYRVHSIPESREQIKRIVEDQLVRADLIIISGESKDESFELISEVLRDLGEITTVHPAMSDAGRFNFGLIGPDQTPVVTLPGEPVSAYLALELFIRPMIRTMLGAPNIFRSRVKVELLNNVSSPAGERSFIRVKVESAKAQVLPKQESLESLVAANGLLLMTEAATSYKAGDLVDVMILERSNN
jgi:molybdenum cofactor synthesis domain-containing protein